MHVASVKDWDAIREVGYRVVQHHHKLNHLTYHLKSDYVLCYITNLRVDQQNLS